ncbi:hypothetical protein V2G26_011986 [Clonostachys chloroleuca]
MEVELHPPSYSLSAQKKRYRFTHRGTGPSFDFTPESPEHAGYTFDVGSHNHGTKRTSYLYQDPRHILASATRRGNSCNYKIYLGNAIDDFDDEMAWDEMRTDCPNTIWSMTSAYDGQTKAYFMWKRTTNIAVDGIKKPSRLSRRNWILVDHNDQREVLAVYTENLGFSTSGTLQINVDWGNDFECFLLLSLGCMYPKSGMPTSNAISKGGAYTAQG